MASNPIVAKYSAEKKTLVFSVDPCIYDAYKKGKTCKEMYLPITRYGRKGYSQKVGR